MQSRVMFITGGSTGIGAATARMAVGEGFRVVVTARSEEKLQALAEELGRDQVRAVRCDVQDQQSLEAAVEETIEHFGRLDVVFANAGVGGEPGGFSSAPPDSWREMLMTNVFGLALTLRSTAAHLKASRGHVVITSSVAGRRSLAGSMYSATKWAATCIGHGFRKELAGTGVRVTLIEPGLVDTPFFDEPKKGYLESEDVARAVLYAVNQPPHAEVHEVTLVPMRQQDDNLLP
ncbi:MAG: SDR family oxidoreductase [Xanthomonadales bacterium]|nr:SDR family oxidoreductase [Xanthomonadales bacterium]